MASRLNFVDSKGRYSTEATSSESIVSFSSTARGELTNAIDGRSVTNILSDDVAGAESTTGWTASGGAVVIDSSNEFEGTNCLKFTLSTTSGTVARNILPLLDTTKYYLITGHIKNNDFTNALFYANCVGDAGLKLSTASTSTTYTRVGLVLQPSDFNGASSVNLTFYAEGANTNFGFFDALQLNEITSAEYALGADALLDRYPFHRGTSHTNPFRIVSEGKNIFDKNSATDNYFLNALTGALTANTAFFVSDYIPVSVGDSIAGNFGCNSASAGVGYFNYKQEFIGGSPLSEANTEWTRTIPSDVKFVRTTCRKDYGNLDTFQLELGTSKTTYQPYKSNQAVCTKPCRSVPAIADTFDTNTGIHTQNVEASSIVGATDFTSMFTSTTNVDVALSPSPVRSDIKTGVEPSIRIPGYEITTFAGYDDVANIGKFYVTNSGGLRYIVAKGTALATAQAEVDGLDFYYQLATPIETYLGSNTLNAYASGRQYQEPYIENYGTYASGLSVVDSTYPIDHFKELIKIDFTNFGEYVVIPNSDITLAGDGLTFTVSGAVDGEVYFWGYGYANQFVNGELTYSHAVNHVAQTDSNTKQLSAVGKRLNDLDKYLERQLNGWEDLQFKISSGKVPAANFPDYATFTTNSSEFAFGVDEFIDLAAEEPPHDHKVGSTGHFHMHFAPKSGNSTGSDRFAQFTIYIPYLTLGGTWTETSLTAEATIPDGTGALDGLFLDFGDFDLSNVSIGGQMKVRIKRIAATGGTEFADDVFITQVGMHYLKDGIGTQYPMTK